MEPMKTFCERLGIPYHEEAIPFYEEGMKMKEEFGSAIAEEERLISFNQKYNFFRKWFDVVLKAAAIIKKDDDLLLYNYTLYCVIKAKAPVSILPPPDKGVIETDFSPMFALLWFLEDMIQSMETRGLPHQVISDTLQGFEAEINDYNDMFGRPGMRRYVNWFTLFIRGEIIRVGRLHFQFTTLKEKIRVYQKDEEIQILMDGETMHKKGMVFGSGGQTEEDGKYIADLVITGETVSGYPANAYGECVPERITLTGYTEVLKQGDAIVSVHIPSAEPFTAELCEQSFQDAKKIIKQYYSELNIKAFYCHSWMLEKRLRDILGKDTNVTKFADFFHGVPCLSEATGVYSFLFHQSKPIPPEELPEETSMQRAVKDYLCNGNYFYEKAGIMPL